MSQNIQKLINVWDNRPRRQLDFSLLNRQSQEDVEFVVNVLQALIPVAVREIEDKFGLRPEPPIVIQLQMKPANEAAVLPAGEVGATQDVSGQPPTPQIERTEEIRQPKFSDFAGTAATPKDQVPASVATTPSKLASKARGVGHNTRTPKATRSKGGTASKSGHKSGSAGRPSSGPATPAEEPAPAPATEPSSTPAPASPGSDLSGPPHPTLSSIGE